MALKNVPFRSEVLAWNPDNLADYFRKVSLSRLCFWLGWYAFSWVDRDWRWNLDRMWKAYGIVVDTRRQTDIAFLVMCPEEKDEGGGPQLHKSLVHTTCASSALQTVSCQTQPTVIGVQCYLINNLH